jgi:hypothetical protein
MQAVGGSLRETVTTISRRSSSELEGSLDAQLERMPESFRQAMKAG